MRKFLQKHLDDTFLTVGAGLVIAAVYLWLGLPAGLGTAGVFCLAAGVMTGIGQGRKEVG